MCVCTCVCVRAKGDRNVKLCCTKLVPTVPYLLVNIMIALWRDTPMPCQPKDLEAPLGSMSNDVWFDRLQCGRQHLLLIVANDSPRLCAHDWPFKKKEKKLWASAAVGVPVPPVVPSICTSRGRLARTNHSATTCCSGGNFFLRASMVAYLPLVYVLATLVSAIWGTLASLTLAGMPQNHRTFRTLHTSEGMTMNLANHTQQVSGENPL